MRTEFWPKWSKIRNDRALVNDHDVIFKVKISLHHSVYDFEIRNKQMFTEARAFSRVTFFFCFLASQLDFFLNFHSEISYPTPFSETVQRDDTNFGPFLFYSVSKWRLKYGKRQPVAMEENSRQIQKKQPFLYIVMVCFYHRRFYDSPNGLLLISILLHNSEFRNLHCEFQKSELWSICCMGKW